MPLALAALVLGLPAAADQLVLSPLTPFDITAVGLSSVGDLAFENGAVKLWICDGSTNGLVHELNPLTGALLSTVDPVVIPGFNLGADALAISPASAAHDVVVFSAFGESEGGRVSQAGALVADFGAGREATGAAFDTAGNLWVTSGTVAGGGTTLRRLDPSTGAILASVPILGTTSRMIDLAFDPHTGACYVLAEDTGFLIEVNTSTGAQISGVDLSSFLPAPRAIAGGIAFDHFGANFFVAGAGQPSSTILRFRREFGILACDGSGVFAPCPCGNTGAPGSGCASSVSTAGAEMVANGLPTVGNDTLFLVASNVPATTSVLFFQGTTLMESTPLALGDGLICVAGAIIRLGTKTASGGTAQYPDTGDPDLHVRGAIPATGATRYYQAWYRNAASFCTPSTFNFTSAVQVRWAP
ncbi:MAG: hypothetical protein IPJ77_07640 [Planctomycetes bacterium]|nr:hypothetical protein [Planctomycetota bacterium]